MKRRSFLAVGFAAIGARELGAPAIAADPLTTIRIGSTPDVDAASVIWQVPNGVFERLGIRLEAQRLGSGSTIAAAVIGGSIDIGSSSIFGLMNAHLKGVPFVLESVAAVYDASNPGTAFAVAKDSPISHPAQLNGATISVSALGDLFAVATSAWVDSSGGNSRTLNFVELPVPAAAAAIASGRISGALLVEPALQEGLERGQIRVLGYPYNLIAPRFGITYYFCTDGYAKANVELLARFRHGLAEEATYAFAHRKELYALAATVSGTKLETMQRIPFDLGSGIDVRTVQTVIDYAARYKLIPKAFPAAEMIDPNALN